MIRMIGMNLPRKSGWPRKCAREQPRNKSSMPSLGTCRKLYYLLFLLPSKLKNFLTMQYGTVAYKFAPLRRLDKYLRPEKLTRYACVASVSTEIIFNRYNHEQKVSV